MDHGLAGVHLTSEAGRPIVGCLCGCIASGVRDATWLVVDNGNGTATIRPSFNWRGHFHVTADPTPILRELPANYRICDEEAAPEGVG